MRNRIPQGVRRIAFGAAVIVLSPLLIVLLTLLMLYRSALYAWIWLWLLPRGRDVLFVYSESPIWHDYMVNQVLPLVSKRAWVLNWSQRSRWRRFSIAVRLFNAFGGSRKFNPMVIVFRPFSWARKFRFFLPFKGWKHGNKAPVEQLREELVSFLEHGVQVERPADQYP